MVWEHVLASDWAQPGSAVLARLHDPRVTQFWDPDRTLSHALGEDKAGKPVWDWLGIYPAGALWSRVSAQPAYSGRPVVNVAASAARFLAP